MTVEGGTIAGVDVSRETITKLEGLAALITKWTKAINLIAPKSVPELWERHITDSIQLISYVPEQWESWIDLGSGGGLPGLVIAILDQSRRRVTLVESDTRKALFLNTVRRELDLNVTVVNQRIERAAIDPADVVSARALAPLDRLLPLSAPLLKRHGVALFPKGAQFQNELDQAAKEWHFEHLTHISQTSADARILELSGIRKRER